MKEDEAGARNHVLIDFAYPYVGLCGLANAHRAGTMAGHMGTAEVTSTFRPQSGDGMPDVAEVSSDQNAARFAAREG
jgi:hypothetical protein